MRHELDPERRQHVEEGGLLVGAIAVVRARNAVALIAVRRVALIPGKQLSADDLRIGLEQPDPPAVAVPGNRVALEFGKCRFEFDIAGEQLPARSHRRVANIVADAGQGAVSDQRSFAELRSIGCDVELTKRRVAGRQPHLLPGLEDRAIGRSSVAGRVLLEGLVVEQVEPDQLHALVFEIDQRAVDPALVPVQDVTAGFEPIGAGAGIARRPIVRPVDPGCFQLCDGLFAAPAKRMALADLAEEAFGSIRRELTQPVEGQFRAGENDREVVLGEGGGRGKAEGDDTAGDADHWPSHGLLLRVHGHPQPRERGRPTMREDARTRSERRM